MICSLREHPPGPEGARRVLLLSSRAIFDDLNMAAGPRGYVSRLTLGGCPKDNK